MIYFRIIKWPRNNLCNNYVDRVIDAKFLILNATIGIIWIFDFWAIHVKVARTKLQNTLPIWHLPNGSQSRSSKWRINKCFANNYHDTTCKIKVIEMSKADISAILGKNYDLFSWEISWKLIRDSQCGNLEIYKFFPTIFCKNTVKSTFSL